MKGKKIMKKATVLLASCMIMAGLLFTGCSDTQSKDISEEKVEKQKNIESESKEKTISSAKQEDEKESIPQKNTVVASYVGIQDTQKVDSIVIYNTNGELFLTALDKGTSNRNSIYGYSQQMPIVGRYVLNGDDKNVYVSDFSCKTSEFQGLTNYSIDATLKSENQTKFLVAYEVYTDVSNYFSTGIGVFENGELIVADYISDRERSDESYNIKILGTVDFDSFDNSTVFYGDTTYDIGFDTKRGELSYKKFDGSTAFSLNDNTFVGVLRMQENCDSEAGKTSRYTFVPVSEGRGAKITFLRLPGEQAENPTYQFIADGSIKFQPVNSDGTYE